MLLVERAEKVVDDKDFWFFVEGSCQTNSSLLLIRDLNPMLTNLSQIPWDKFEKVFFKLARHTGLHVPFTVELEAKQDVFANCRILDPDFLAYEWDFPWNSDWSVLDLYRCF